MSFSLANKHIVLGVTGSIAAYKSADLARRLREVGAVVRVVMTDNAKQFITPLTMQAVSGNPIHDDLFDLQAEAAMGHIELARWADLILIAPATADCIARLAVGKGNDLLTAVCLASKAPIAVAPAMNQGMWQDTATASNVQALKQKDIHVLGPGAGSQACGDVGFGRMLEPLEIIDRISTLFLVGALAGVRVMITAGPTQEPIDPVRFISNNSSGKMGYALAEAARESGALVTLISGPVHLPVPQDMHFVSVISAQEMYAAVMRNVSQCDIFLSVAAVSDYRSEIIADQKIHKHGETMQLNFVRNPDIVTKVAELPERPFIVGFAAETENIKNNAQAKRERKNLDMIVANSVQLGMGGDENEVTILSEHVDITLPLASKRQIARQLIKLITMEYSQVKEIA
jgi:phosphopantothenoylcysteine decarboxylase/phosphopantothenate--cysteine ligase